MTTCSPLLVKHAAGWNSAVSLLSSLMAKAKPMAGPAATYGIPLAAGGATAGVAHQQGATPFESTMLGLGGASLADTKMLGAAWRNRNSIPNENALSGLLKNMMPSFGRKAGFAGLAAAPSLLGSFSQVAKDVAGTTKNVNTASGELARATAGVGDKVNSSLEKQLGNYEAGSDAFKQTLANTATMMGEKGLGGAAANIKDTAGKLDSTIGNINSLATSMNSELPKLTGAAQDTSKALNTGADAFKSLSAVPGRLSEWATSSGTVQGLKVGTGVAGGLGAAYLLHQLLSNKKKDNSRQSYQQ